MNRRTVWTARLAVSLPLLGLAVFLAACNNTKPTTTTELPGGDASQLPTVPPGPPMFEDKTDASGVRFQYRDGEDSKYYTILDSLGGGAALIDFDGDGLLDIFVPGGGHFQDDVKAYQPKAMAEFLREKKTNPEAKLPPPPRISGYPGRLYRNKGNFQFEDVTEKVFGQQPDLYTHGAAVGDYDRDGWPDLLVTGYGRVILYHNEPDGKGGRKFVDVTEKAGLLGPNAGKRSEESGQPGDHFWATSAAWGDLDGDGYPELYVCQYVNWSFAKNHPVCSGYSTKVEYDVCPPKQFASVPHALWRNNGNGTFTNVTREAGLRVEREDKDYGKGLGVQFVDVDGDGKADIYVCNDTTDNFLYLNRSTPGKLKFEDKGLALGVARDQNGVPNGSMGVDSADWDGSGRPSIFVTNYESEYHALYKNMLINGRLSYSFATMAAGLSSIGPNYVGFGTKFVDVDNDGWEDIVIANGHVVYFPPRDNLKQRPVLFMNMEHKAKSGPTRRFADGTARGGNYFAEGHRNRGLAVGDLDNDGHVDLVFVPVNDQIRILRNVAAPENGWLGVELRGKDRRDLVGTRLTLEVGDRKLVRFIKGGGSYLSAHDQRVVFGLGSEKKAGRLIVDWPGGQHQAWDNLETGKYHKLEQK